MAHDELSLEDVETGHEAAVAIAAPEPASAQTLAGRGILLEIGARSDLLDPLAAGDAVTAEAVAQARALPARFVENYYHALAHAGLAEPGDGGTWRASPLLGPMIHDVGYLTWGLISCAPLLANAPAFAADMDDAAEHHPRDGEHVARTSRWMGERDFYPQAVRAILDLQPKRLVDLGSGSCGLLIRCLRQLPGATGLGIDLSAEACAKARETIADAGMTDRIGVVEAAVQEVADDPRLLDGADLVHAGFVLHDLMPADEASLDRLLAAVCAAGATMLIVDAVPFGDRAGEEAFSAAFTFLHHNFMSRRLQPADEWVQRLRKAGFATVEVEPLGIPGGRLFRAGC